MPVALGTVASHRTAPSGPAIPTTGLLFWLDADDASTFTYSSGAKVSQWNDKSANGSHGIQANVTYQPTRVIAAVNGKAAVEFNAAAAANGHGFTTTGSAESTAFTRFAVIVRKTRPDVGHITGAVFSGAFTPSWRIEADARQAVLLPGYGWMVGPSNTGFAVDTPTQLTVEHASAGAWTCYRNGVADGSGTAAYTPGVGAKIVLGGSQDYNFDYPYTGHMCELIFYDRVLTTPERQQVESYLKGKWSTP